MIQVKIPELADSIQEAQIANWFKNEGEKVMADEAIAELETEKATVELYAPAAGILHSIKKQKGENVKINEIIAEIDDSATAQKTEKKIVPQEEAAGKKERFSPAAEKISKEHRLEPKDLQGSGKDGLITKQDIIRHLENQDEKTESPASMENQGIPEKIAKTDIQKFESQSRTETIVPMSKLRQTIARRLLEAQHNAAILTTFNEIDMSKVNELRTEYKDKFKELHNVSLGFMSIFTKAATSALQIFPAINAEIRDGNLVYKKYYDIGIAVGGPRGLVVPVLKDADLLDLADIEKEITRLAGKVKDGTISLDEMKGGTFTISNGGIYGSLLSTPIINPPQSAILGMHKIEKRPVVINEQIVIRPMMYVALSYDHRIVDGKEAVQFLLKIKEMVEDPIRLLLQV